MISERYNETISVQRLATVYEGEGSDIVATKKKDFQAHLTHVSCFVQAYDEDITRDIQVGYGKNFRLFCGIADIIEGDRVLRYPGTASETEYRVVALKKFAGYGANSHMEILIRVFQS
jgi:hypothetical protein